MSTTTLPAPAGFHGKLRRLGDFVHRRLPPDFVSPWDHAFRVALDGVATRLGDDWRQRCLDAPAWRFALAGGVCGRRPWIGVVAPSSDRVGRVFPLVIAISPLLARDGWPRLPAQAWFERAEAALGDARDTGSLADFDAAVHTLPDPEAAVVDVWVPAEGEQMRSLWWRGADPRRGVLLRSLPDEIDYLRFIYGTEAENHEESA